MKPKRLMMTEESMSETSNAAPDKELLVAAARCVQEGNDAAAR